MRPRARARAQDRGSITPFVAIIAGGLVFVAGMVYDGGQILSTYTRAGDLAANAARAAAQATDPAELYASGTVRLDEDDARARADALLSQAGYPGTGDVNVEGNQVTVTVTLTHDPHILPIAARRISASASATAIRGVEGG
jgi:putative Flp pilus-assembly TadE/G-like protein